MARRQAAALAIGLASVLAACGLPGDERTFSVGSVEVVDGSGLVTAARDGAPQPGTDERPLIVSPGNLTEIAIHWEEVGCPPAWRIRIPEGNALRVIIEPVGAPREPCPVPVAEDRAITLELDRVVQADAIEVEQVSAP